MLFSLFFVVIILNKKVVIVIAVGEKGGHHKKVILSSKSKNYGPVFLFFFDNIFLFFLVKKSFFPIFLANLCAGHPVVVIVIALVINISCSRRVKWKVVVVNTNTYMIKKTNFVERMIQLFVNWTTWGYLFWNFITKPCEMGYALYY